MAIDFGRLVKTEIPVFIGLIVVVVLFFYL